jgi:hypothetical protein
MSVSSQHLWSLLNPAEPQPAFNAAPADVAAKDRILLLAKYAMQNGPSFVDMVRSNQGEASHLAVSRMHQRAHAAQRKHNSTLAAAAAQHMRQALSRHKASEATSI